jgi:hypothetical protein
MEITARNGRWNVTIDWPEAHEAYDEEGSPAERAIAAVAERHDVAVDQFRSTVIRTSEDGLTVVVKPNK